MALNGLLWLGLLVCVCPVVVFCLQVFTAWLRPGPTGSGTGDGLDNPPPPTSVILMPAHNEEKVIGDTLARLKGLLPQVRVLVVADNCTDATADIARSLGAWVVERTSADLRGKGYALQYGLEQLRAQAPEVVMVLDADCSTTPADMHRLAFACARMAVPVQGIYLMHAPEGAAIGGKVAEFAWLVKTMVRPLGWRAWGGTCQLMGSGFALPWHIAQTLNLASGHIVEDMKLTMDLAARRLAPVFVGTSKVTSVFPTAVAAQSTQRRRWEHGHLGMIVSEVPRALLKAALTANRQLAAVALDLLVPPLSLLVLLLAGLSLLALVQAVGWGLSWAVWLVWLLAAALGCAVLLAWSTWGRAVLTARELASIPGFVWRKLGVYTGFLWRRERQWTRTDRD